VKMPAKLQHPDLEDAVVGYLSVAGAEGIRHINPDDFVSSLAGIVYAAALTLKKKGKPVQAFTIIEAVEANPHWLRLANDAAEAGGYMDWRDVLVNADSSTASNRRGADLVNEWLEDIAEAAQSRAATQIGVDLQSAEITPQEALRRLQGITSVASSGRAGVQIHTFKELYAYKKEEDTTTLLGDRWVCQGAQLLLVGQSGIGKSSLTVQASMTWGLGRPFFGIAPARPLKSLYVQAENDEGDMAEVVQGVMTDVINKSGMDKERCLKQLQDNLLMVRSTSQTGDEFVALVGDLCQEHGPFDLVFADPLLSFIGDDISQQSVASHFLRELCNPLAFRHKFAWVFSHHTGKPQSDSKARQHWNTNDYAYIGLGSSELTNWARAIAVLQTTHEEGTFKLLLAKRGRRAGVVNDEGHVQTCIGLRHAEKGLHWETAILPEEPEGEKGKRGAPKKISPVQEAELIVMAESWEGSKTDLYNAAAKRFKTSDRTIKDRLKELQNKA
jgi:hypothetical protein